MNKTKIHINDLKDILLGFLRINQKISKALIYGFTSILLLTGFLAFPLKAQDIDIGLFYSDLLNSAVFHCTEGEYTLSSESGFSVDIKQGDIFYLSLVNGTMTINDGNQNYENFRSLLLKDNTLEGRIRIKAVEPSQEAANYSGDFKIRLNHKAIQIINTIPFDDYLAGVVESEAGPGAPFEFFKAQAVLCRTYAMKNWNRHISEGFNLCDKTHCQAFHGISDDNPDILTAVLATHKIVVTNKYSYLIDAAYHSNSGGETQRADGFWPGDHDYLQAIIDPFSVDQKNYSWKESMQLNTWRGYLATKEVKIAESDTSELLIQQEHRKKFAVINEDTLSLKDIREDLDLNSAFFNMEYKDDQVIFHGKGYGHGVGLSQEGAMEMARQGFTYTDILHFYYHQVLVKNYELIPVSELPEEFREF